MVQRMDVQSFVHNRAAARPSSARQPLPPHAAQSLKFTIADAQNGGLAHNEKLIAPKGYTPQEHSSSRYSFESSAQLGRNEEKNRSDSHYYDDDFESDGVFEKLNGIVDDYRNDRMEDDFPPSDGVNGHMGKYRTNTSPHQKFKQAQHHLRTHQFDTKSYPTTTSGHLSPASLDDSTIQFDHGGQSFGSPPQRPATVMPNHHHPKYQQKDYGRTYQLQSYNNYQSAAHHRLQPPDAGSEMAPSSDLIGLKHPPATVAQPQPIHPLFSPHKGQAHYSTHQHFEYITPKTPPTSSKARGMIPVKERPETVLDNRPRNGQLQPMAATHTSPEPVKSPPIVKPERYESQSPRYALPPDHAHSDFEHAVEHENEHAAGNEHDVLPAEEETDYPFEELRTMPDTTLRAESFDTPAETEPPGAQAHPANQPLNDRLQAMASQDGRHQQRFLHSLTLEQWQEAGVWFSAQFAAISQKLAEVRREKRKIAESLEREVWERYEAVMEEDASLQQALHEMKREGKALLRQSTPRRSSNVSKT